MAAYTKPSKAALLSQCRRQLADLAGRWWSDDTLNNYITDWQSSLNDQFEWVHQTATVLATGSSVTLPTSGGRVVYVVQNNVYLPRTNEGVLQEIDINWRHQWGSLAAAYLQYSPTTIMPWPKLLATTTLVVEYIGSPTFATGTSTIDIPAFAKWSCVPYVCGRAYGSLGPNHDFHKAMRYKKKFERWKQIFASAMTKQWACRAPRLKQDATAWEAKLVRPVGVITETQP
jgi:hypothetical protein